MANEIKVLLVEEYDGRAALRKLLAGAQLNVVGEAGFGTETVTAAQQLKPDVVILSLEEPVARPLKAIESLVLSQKNVIVVVISSLGERDSLRKAMQAGASDYLVKPVRPQELHRAVVTLFHKKDAGRQSEQKIRQGDVITVFGVKGGIGKTSLSTNIAAAVAAESKQRVGLVDLDMQLGDIAILLNFVPKNTIYDAVGLLGRLEPDMLQSLLWQDASGLSVLPAPLRPEEAEEISPDHVRQVLAAMAKTFDYVVLDTPPVFSEAVGAALDQSTLILLMTTQDIFSLRRTKVALEMMRSWGYSEDKVKLVINHAYSVNGINSSDIENSLEYPIFWKVPNDPVVETASRQGRPFVSAFPHSRVGKNVVDLARVVSGLKKRQTGLMGKLLSR